MPASIPTPISLRASLLAWTLLPIACAMDDGGRGSDEGPDCAGKCDHIGEATDADALGGPRQVRFDADGHYLVVEVLDDDLVHFELSAVGDGPDGTSLLFTTPMVAKTGYPGPHGFVHDGATIETDELRVVVDTSTLCVAVTDLVRDAALTRICPRNLAQDWKGLTLDPSGMEHVYGLGQEFIDGSTADGDWTGRVRSPGGPDGNAMVGFDNGANGNTQIPVMYAVGPDSHNYALFLDQAYKQRWDFTGSPWVSEMWGDQIRWYVMSGPDLPDLRRDYMELVGRPLVPPKKAFGLWISEYGFDDWAELEDKLATLHANHFPVDGFMLDLQWFGGVTSGSDASRMGTLSWDPQRFPDPAGRLARLATERGVGVIPIEESYVSRGLAEHADLASRGFLARACDSCGPTYLTGNPWWGTGGMIDWTHDAGADDWHDAKRQPLIDDGVIGHWTDLGEPEMYDWRSRYHGVPGLGPAHADVHNIYNLKWIESIWRGYERNAIEQRPFIVSRSGAAGIQRYGAAMWSADIGTNYAPLIAHLNAQMHMSMSGIDYYGADIGGFHREGLRSDLGELYTQWFADAMMLDVPGRSHTENICNCKETAPDRVGDLASNLANVRLRYALSPYLYSLAHRAHRDGDPVFPPLVYRFQNDPVVREMGHEKLIGDDLLLGIVAGAGETHRGVYLPAGTWIDFHANTWVTTAGSWVENIPEFRDGRFTLPLFARAGAIVPMMFVDDRTMNILGMRSDGTTRDELIARVFPSPYASSFTLFEDDGQTNAYLAGEVRQTELSQTQADDGTITVTVAASSGSYEGAPLARDTVVELALPSSTVPTRVELDGVALAKLAAPDAEGPGWYVTSSGLLIARAGDRPVAVQKVFTFAFGA